MKPLASIASAAFIICSTFASCDHGPNGPTPVNYIIEGPQDQFPSFSPDGNSIAYYHHAWEIPEPAEYPSGLYTMDKDGGNRRLVLAGHYLSPSWSPDGEWLVFSTGGTLQKCRINGEDLTTFSALDGLDYPRFYFPDWSSDGSRILFDKPLGSIGGLFSTTSDFGNAGRPFDIEILGRDPELSPERESIVYQRGFGDNVEVSEIFLIDTLGENEVQLTVNGNDNRAPSWSQDGQRIAWSSGVRIFIMNRDGTDQHQISYGNDPSWSVNDEIVYSHANEDYTKEVLYIISIDGQTKRQVTF